MPATWWTGLLLLATGTAVAALAAQVRRRRAAEDEVRRLAADRSAERRFELFVEAAPNAVIAVDGSGLIVLVNTQAENLFGYPRDELLGRPVEVLVPERFRSAHAGHRGGFLAAPSARAMGAGRDLFGLRRDGREVPVEIGLNPITTAEGPFVLASIIDITERKRAEERFRLVVESAPNAMLMVDGAGRIALVNGQAEGLFGYPREDLLGRPMEMLVPERYRSAHGGLREGFFAAPSARAMGAGRDLYALRADGAEVPVEIGLNPIRTDEGPMVLASIIDITERLQAARRLEESLREKELLLKEVHHRVKNNLAVIGSLFYLQAGATGDPDTLRILQVCRERVRSMALVHERLYRSEDLAEVDFAEYAAELAREMVRNSAAARADLRLDLDIAPTPLAIDRAIPCGLILTELISNALKHAFPDGRPGTLRVALGRRPDGGLELTVADDGVGLPDDAPGDADRTLGLRLVRSLAGQLDADLTFLRDRPGTEVRLTLSTEAEHAAAD